MKIEKRIIHLIELPANRIGDIDKYLRFGEDVWYRRYGEDYSIAPYNVKALEKEFQSIVSVMHEQLELFPCEL